MIVLKMEEAAKRKQIIQFSNLRILLLVIFSFIFSAVYAQQQELVFRTGLYAKKAWFSVSPDGKLIVFSTDKISQGTRLLDLTSGKISVLLSEPSQTFGFPAWSPDGRHIVLQSAEMRGGKYDLDRMEIVLFDSSTGQQQSISVGEGIKFSPFFSADGKIVYYFKGQKRESGKTPGSRYDLYAIELASRKEARLTHEEFYQAAKGDDSKSSVLFNATPNFAKSIKDEFRQPSRNALFLYEKDTAKVSIVPIDQSSGIFDFYSPQRDKTGSFYFVAAKNRPGGGNYLWFLIRTNSEGKRAEVLAELPISMKFDIAQKTGEIFVTDIADEELIFRQLRISAAY